MPTSTAIGKVAHWSGKNFLVVGVLGTLMSAATLGISAMTILAARSEVTKQAHENSLNVTAVLVSEIAKTVETSNAALIGLTSNLGNPAFLTMDARLRHELLFERTAAKYVTGMGVTDAQGQLIDGCCGSTHRWDFSDRDYFTVQRDKPDIGLYLSEPYEARSRAGTSSIALSRRIDGPNHTFNGIAVVSVDLAYFTQLLSRLNVGRHGVSAIVRTDGAILARNPPVSDAEMARLRSSRTFANMTRSDSGFYTARSSIDGVTRLYTFQRVPGTPLIAVVAPAEQDVLASITLLTRKVGISATIISALFCTTVWLLAFILRDNLRIQRKLMNLSRTDALTGLLNRRALDSVLTDEWGRIHRNNTCMSMLFIDVDHFKQYNDIHGHAKGDAALRFVSECIRRHLRRHGDTAARYGGEEFVVVLANTDEHGATTVAEAIRQEVEGNRLANFPDPVPALTVSIGCATGRKGQWESVDALSNQADLALYQAKHLGRNRVHVSSIEDREARA